MRRRNRHVSVWMNEQEYQHLKAQAKKAGLGIDPFIRNLVAGVQLRPRPPDEVAALVRGAGAPRHRQQRQSNRVLGQRPKERRRAGAAAGGSPGL